MVSLPGTESEGKAAPCRCDTSREYSTSAGPGWRGERAGRDPGAAQAARSDGERRGLAADEPGATGILADAVRSGCLAALEGV